MYDDKLKSKYSEKIFEIIKLKNNSVIIKDDKDNLYQARKNEIKIVVKPDNPPIELKAKKIASIDSKQEKIMKKEDIDETNIRTSTRIRKPNPKYN